MALQHFETFLAVAEAGSFTAAAKQLGHSKASVSQTIRLLETSLELPLFIRSTRRVRLSDEGVLLFEQCQRLKKELDGARELVKSFKPDPSGTLRISCNPYFVECHLFKLLQRYLDQFPNVKLEIFSEERMPDLQREQIDIVFGTNLAAPDDVVAKPIATTRYVLCASPAYLEKFGTPTTLKALETHRYIPHLGRQSGDQLVTLKKPNCSHLPVQLSLNNAHFIKKCALLGWGIVQLHNYLVQAELENGTLVDLLPDQFQSEVPLYIYYQKHRFVQPKIRQFVNLTEEFCKL